MLYSNYNVYIIWYLHIMVSTYYYIYILVDTYYVINGLNIIDYLHNGIVEIKGVCRYIATPYPLENHKRGMATVTLHHNYELHQVIAWHWNGLWTG